MPNPSLSGRTGILLKRLRDAKAAVKADPKYEFGHTWYARLLLRFGWPEEAYQQAKISESLVPNKPVIYRTYGDIYYAETKFHECH